MSAQNAKGIQSIGRTKPLSSSEANVKTGKPVGYIFNHSITPIYDMNLHKKTGTNGSNGNGKASNTFEIPDEDIDTFLSDPQGFLGNLAKKKQQKALISVRSDSPISEQII